MAADNILLYAYMGEYAYERAGDMERQDKRVNILRK